MPKDNGIEKNPFSDMMKGFGIKEARQGFGLPGLMIGKGVNGEPGIQVGGKFIPFSKATLEKGGDGKNGDKETDAEKKAKEKAIRLRTVGPRIMDVDFNMQGKMSRTPAIKPVPRTEDTKKTMKAGGLVKGCGMAQRGKGRGKMV